MGNYNEATEALSEAHNLYLQAKNQNDAKGVEEKMAKYGLKMR